MAFDPVTMALLMAGSSAVKGIGQGISSFQQAEGIMGEEEKRMLRRLQREQEMNALGFSDSEIGDLTRQYRNPQQAIAKAQADQLAMGMAASGVGGPADAFRMALAQQDQQNRMNAEIADKISAMNVAEKQREEQMLLSLSRQEAAQEAAKKAAITQALTLGIGGAAESAAQAQLLSEQANYQEGIDAQQLEMQQQYLNQLGILANFGIGIPGGAQ